MVYTDEAVVEDGRITVWHFKADWSPETIAATMYITHLGVFRRSLAVELGGFRSRYDGTQDYDFVLRLGDRTDRIAHIPEVLYYWRAHGSSTAGGVQAKPYAYAIQPGSDRASTSSGAGSTPRSSTASGRGSIGSCIGSTRQTTSRSSSP